MAISPETKSRVAQELLAIRAAIEAMEASTPHDQLPPEYDRLILRRNAGEALLAAQEPAAAPVAQEPQEPAVPVYVVRLHSVNLFRGEGVNTLYTGDDEDTMYSHVTAIEVTLVVTFGTAEIEIVERGESRWIDYRDGIRDGMDQSQ